MLKIIECGDWISFQYYAISQVCSDELLSSPFNSVSVLKREVITAEEVMLLAHGTETSYQRNSWT